LLVAIIVQLLNITAHANVDCTTVRGLLQLREIGHATVLKFAGARYRLYRR